MSPFKCLNMVVSTVIIGLIHVYKYHEPPSIGFSREGGGGGGHGGGRYLGKLREPCGVGNLRIR